MSAMGHRSNQGSQRTLLGVHFHPPMAIARVGASPTPLDAFEWVAGDSAHGGTSTVLRPAVSFTVRDDGSVQPFVPTQIRFKDDDGAIRPVAPFLELWATLQRSDDGSTEEVALNLALLHELGIGLDHLALEVTASNLKAARRADDIACGFTARTEIAGTDHARHPLLAFSRHTSGQKPLVLPDHPIPLGAVQWLLPRSDREPGFGDLDLSTLRLRYTPAAGEVYGPPAAAYGPDRLTVSGRFDSLEFSRRQDGRVHMIVKPENRILAGDTTFSEYRMVTGLFEDPQPQDGYDGGEEGDSRAWGVVDDTCDVLVSVSLAWRGQRFRTHGRIFVGPPQYAPDRRPFYGIDADLADRDQPLVAVNAETFDAVKTEVVELFRRIFETASAMNLDAARTEALQDNVGGTGSAPPPLYSGGGQDGQQPLPRVDGASMTRDDTPFADRMPDLTPGQSGSVYSTPLAGSQLSFTEAVPHVHGQLMDEAILIDFLRRRAAHVKRLLRPPFGLIGQWDVTPGDRPHADFRDPRIPRDLMHDMRMPPYMRDAYYVPLSLTRRQYRMMIDFLDLLAAQAADATRGAAA